MIEILLIECMSLGQRYYLTPPNKLHMTRIDQVKKQVPAMDKSLWHKFMVLVREDDHQLLLQRRAEKQNHKKEPEEEPHFIWAASTTECHNHHVHVLAYSLSLLFEVRPCLRHQGKYSNVYVPFHVIFVSFCDGYRRISASLVATFLPTETWNQISYKNTSYLYSLHLY